MKRCKHRQTLQMDGKESRFIWCMLCGALRHDRIKWERKEGSGGLVYFDPQIQIKGRWQLPDIIATLLKSQSEEEKQ